MGTILTENPFRLTALYLLRQFICHHVKTLNGVRNVVGRFEMFTYCLVNGKSRDLELRNNVSILRYTSIEDLRTPLALVKAFSHESFVNITFAHFIDTLW